MKKPILTILLCGVVLLGVTGCGSNNQSEDNKGDKKLNNNGNSVVIYFSQTGTTKEVANFISDITTSDIIEIIPKQKYTKDDLNYNNDNSRANKEQNDSSARPEIQNSIDITKYDTIYLGYPIWWGTSPKIILTFLDTYDLSGKTIIPFCTSGESGITTSVNYFKNNYKNINWMEGKRLTNSKKEVIDWLNSLK